MSVPPTSLVRGTGRKEASHHRGNKIKPIKKHQAWGGDASSFGDFNRGTQDVDCITGRCGSRMWYILERPIDGGCGATIALTGIETCDRVRRRSRLLSAVDAMVLTTECRFERVDAARDCVRERGMGIGDGGCCPRLPLAIELASAG